MRHDLLLVGSVPLDSVEQVMRDFAAQLGPHMPAVPDGEVGERRSWVNRLCYLVFNGHPDLETLRRPKPVDGREQLLPRARDEAWQFRVRPGVAQVLFGNPGTRLGYARDAISSHFVFKTLREKGVLPQGLRFQVSIPMVNSVVRPLYFPEPSDVDKVRPGFEELLAGELATIFARIPHEDLAIQWDCAWETQAVSGAAGPYPAEAEIATHLAPIARLSRDIPDGVALGFHFCFGTFGGWPAFAPELAKGHGRAGQRSRRRIGAARRLDAHPDARHHRRRVLRPPRPPRREGRGDLSRRDPQHGDAQAAARGGAQIPARVRSCRLLRVRPNAAGRAAAHPRGPSGGAAPGRARGLD